MITRRSVRTSPAPRQVGHGCGRNPAPAPALRARPVDGEPALAEGDRAPAVALRAGGPRGARRAAGAGAGRARLGDRQRDRHLAPERRDPERHLDRPSRASRRAAPPGGRPRPKIDEKMSPSPPKSPKSNPSTSKSGPRPPPPGRAPPPGADRAAAAVERAEPPHLIVLLPLVGVGQHAVRLGDLLEALGGRRVVGVGVGVVLLGEPAIGLLDLVLAGRVGDAEDLIEVLGGHVRPVPGRSTPGPARGGPERP